MKRIPLLALALTTFVAGVTAQQARFDDVVRNLRNPDPKARASSLAMLREAGYAEAIVPIAPLVNDPIDAIQLSAIETELSFFLVEDVSARKRVAFIVEVRNSGKAETAFASGPLAVWPREAPAELLTSLLRAVDDENPKVRMEAIYTFGTIARAPLATEHSDALVKALDHYDPAIRAAAARVAGRLMAKPAGEALIKAVNDSEEPVRFAAMRALGEIREESAVVALTQQLEHYRKDEAAWSALDGLARIGHRSSVPVFQARLADRDPFMRRAAAEGLGRSDDPAAAAAVEAAIATERDEMVRAALAFALQKLGRNQVGALAQFLSSDRMAPQIAGYFLEIGSPAASDLAGELKDPNPSVRGNAAVILGAIGTAEHRAALEGLLQDRNRDVVRAAERSLERLKMRGV